MDFRILGPLEVNAGDAPVPVGGAKPRALLAILLLRANEVVSTDRLIDDLWGEQPPQTASKALQVHISQLRKALGATVIQTRPPGYALELESNDLDLSRFQRLHDEARSQLASDPGRAADLLREALALWRGPPLADFAYEPFAQGEIARLEELRAAAVEDRIEADLALGRHAGAIAELDALIAEHPLRERLRAQHMLVLYRSGRQAEALEAYRHARATLTEELGIEPGRELRALHEAILNQDAALDPRPAVIAPDRPSRGGFVGRESELSQLIDTLDASLAGDGRLVLIAGEPGIGKSRLADELIRHAEPRGARMLVGRCWEAGGAPAYWPWVQALRESLRQTEPDTVREQVGRGAADLATMLPELRDLLPDLPVAQAPDSEGARFRLMESVTSFLRAAGSSAPLALLLDDLHAADAASLLLLRFVAGQLAGSRILIIGCYRDTEVTPELAEALAELAREPAVRRISLKGLSGADTSRLLELAMGDVPADGLATRVQTDTQGNPLFATEVGRLLASEGSVGHGRGPLPIPQGVKEAIGRRLQRLSDPCREILALASVIGREFAPSVVAQVSGLQDDELVRALDEASGARLVDGVPETSGRLRFSHILVRDAVYEELPALRRLRLHRAVAEALETLYAGRPEPHLAELAHHYFEAGEPVEKAIEYSQRAGDRAASQHAYEEAARQYTRALGLLETAGSGDVDTTCQLLLSLGGALSRAGSGAEAKETLRRAAALAEEAGRSDQLAQAALEYGGRFAWARASTDPVLTPLLERALAAVGTEDSPERVRLLARLAGASRDERLGDRRARLGEEAVEIATRLGDPATLAFALEGHFVATEGPDETGSGVDLGAKLISIGEEIGDKERVFAGHDHRVHTFWQLGDRAGVDFELDALSRLADELRQPAQRWHTGTGQTMLALMEGRFEQAEQLISETLALGQRAESWNAVVTHRLALFVLRREQGRLAELEDTISRSVHEYPALLRFRCALTHLYGELHRAGDARAALDELLSRDLAHEHLDAEWTFSVALLSDPCASFADERAVAKLYKLLLPYERLYAQAPVEAVFGSVARGLGVLAATLRRYDDAERHFEAAIVTEHSMGARPWLAHAQDDYARMLRIRGAPGDTERAEGLLSQALATYRDLGMDSFASRAAATA